MPQTLVNIAEYLKIDGKPYNCSIRRSKKVSKFKSLLLLFGSLILLSGCLGDERFVKIMCTFCENRQN